MNYNDILESSRGKAAEGLLATKIIDLMDKLRLGANEYSARRWIWELLQNAKDVAYDNTPISIVVSLITSSTKPQLVFKHNGQPFSSDHITSLIHQVSSKKRTAQLGVTKRPTGKFGTGFLSTHLLSEQVVVKGVVKEEFLPYKAFTIPLDRSASDPDEVIESVKKSITSISTILNSDYQIDDFNPKEFNTSFIYQLQESKIEIAETGISDLHVSLPYTLAFVTEINEVVLTHQDTSYHVIRREKLGIEGLEVITVSEKGTSVNSQIDRYIAVLTGNKASIACELFIENGVYKIKDLGLDVPRLFCDFPLIGSEKFPFPVIINSPEFNINEPRNGVWLTNKNDIRVLENEKIMEEAIALLGRLLDYASTNEWENLFEFAKISPAVDVDWLSKSWFDDSVLESIRKLILFTPLITTSIGKQPILDGFGSPQIFFPDGKTDEIRERIWDLTSSLYLYPPLSDIHQWGKVIWQNSLKIDLAVLGELIASTVNMDGLQELLISTGNSVTWLNGYYRIMNLDIVFEDDVIADKYSIIPNQSKVFLKRSDLKKGNDVQNEIKDALEILGVPIRNSLLLDGIYTGARVMYSQKSEQSVIDEINTLLTSTKVTHDLKYKACDHLVSLIPTEDKDNIQRKLMHRFSSRLHSSTVPTIKYVKNNADIWKEADKIQLRTIVSTVAGEKDLGTFMKRFEFSSEIDCIIFLNDFIQFLINNEMDGQLNVTSKPILPNQHGRFKLKDEINLDGKIPEPLKQVAEKLGYNIKDLLLDKRIMLDLPPNRTIAASVLANEISVKALQATAITPRSEDIKEAFKILLLFFFEHPNSAKLLFSDLFLQKHKLYDDEEIATNMKQAEDVKQLMEDLNISSLEQMRVLLSKGISFDSRQDIEMMPITTEILASWGITSMQEYDTLIGADITGEIFRHYSTPTLQMLDFALSLIERAKKNIIAFLAVHPDYDITEMDTLAPTVLGGINKLGTSIHVVFRPGDNGEVLFYYPSEKTTLTLDNAELWVDVAEIDPFHLTLGKILLATGINRIPIHGLNRRN